MPSWGRDDHTRSSGPDYAPLPAPHRLSSVDDPYALTISPHHSTPDLVRPSPSPRDSFIRVEHADAAPDRFAAMPLNQAYSDSDVPRQYGYGNKEGGQQSQWLLETQRKNKRTWWIVGSIVAVVAVIAIVVGVVVGVLANKNNNSNSNSGTSGRTGSDSSSPSSGVVPQTDPNDPSTFEKDARLKKSLYGLAYTPENSQYPACGNRLEDVITDIQLISQLTDTIRLYGADCNQSALVLEAIRQTKVDMKVFLGNYPIPDDSAPYLRQRDALMDAIKTYGTDHIAGVTVGNEFILNWAVDHNTEDANSAIGDVGAQLLIANITDTRNALAALNLPTTLPVGTSDAGSYFNNQVLAAVDYAMANIHAWFAQVPVTDAAAWVNEFYQETTVPGAAAVANNPKVYIAETGWPSGANDTAHATLGQGVASDANLQVFLDTFVCQANTNNIGYFYFEFADETWKDVAFGGVEGHWGLFYPNRTLKNIQIPTC